MTRFYILGTCALLAAAMQHHGGDRVATILADSKLKIGPRVGRKKCDLMGCTKCQNCVATVMSKHRDCNQWFHAPKQQTSSKCVDPSSAPKDCKNAVRCRCQRGNSECFTEFFKSTCFCDPGQNSFQGPPKCSDSRLMAWRRPRRGGGVSEWRRRRPRPKSQPRPLAPPNACNMGSFVSLFGRESWMKRSSNQKGNASTASLMSEDLDSALSGKCSQ